MKCAGIRALLAVSLDEALEPADRATADAHLADCTPCTRWLTERVLIVAVLRGIGGIEAAELPPPIPEYLVRRVLAAYKAAMAKHKKSRKSR